ncbi:MAG: ABC transporter ATP-binding protein [Verrucomicrobiota bacterium]
MSIQFEFLTKQYRKGPPALSALSLEIPAGCAFALMGQNGAGKTTAIQLLLDLLAPTGGGARIFNTPSPRLRPEHRQRIGYVSENQHLPDWMRVDEFVRFLKPMYPAWDDVLTARLLKMFDLPMRQKLGTLSRGQRMKASVLGALCYKPDVLILDEPFSGLDAVIREDLLDALVEFLSEGRRTLLLSSHDMNEVERLADTIGILEKGGLGLQGPVDELLGQAREVSFLTSASNAASPVPPPPADWWNVVARSGGVTFTAQNGADESALAAAIRQCWPDAHSFNFRAPGLTRLYVDYLRRHDAAAGSDSVGISTPSAPAV